MLKSSENRLKHFKYNFKLIESCFNKRKKDNRIDPLLIELLRLILDIDYSSSIELRGVIIRHFKKHLFFSNESFRTYKSRFETRY
jgi:hypothetical protein